MEHLDQRLSKIKLDTKMMKTDYMKGKPKDRLGVLNPGTHRHTTTPII